MDEVKNYLSNLEKLNEMKSRAQKMRSGFNDIARNVKEDCDKKYAALGGECKTFIEKAKPIIKNIIAMNPRAKVSGGRLCLDGKVIASSSFDAVNCFDVAAGSRKEVIRSLKLIAGGDASDSAVLKFASPFNTIIDIMQRADSFADSAYYVLAKQKQDELARLEKDVARLEKEVGGDLPEDIRKENEAEINRVLLGGGEFALRHENAKDPEAAAKAYSKDVRVPIGYNGINAQSAEGGCKLIMGKAVWDLAKNSVLHVTVKDRAEVFIPEVVENIVYQFIRNYPISSVKLVVCNPYSDAGVESFSGGLKIAAPSVFYNSENPSQDSDRDGVRDSVEEMWTLSKSRVQQLPRNTDVLSFNQDNPDSAYQIALLVLNDYSEYYYDDVGETLSKLFEQGRLGGVFSLVIQPETPRRVKTSYYRDSVLPDLSKTPEAMQVTLDSDGVNPVILCGQDRFNGNLRGDDFSVPRITEQVKKAISEGTVSISLEDLVVKWEEKFAAKNGNFSKIISIPIGRSAKNTVTIDFNVKNTTAHAAIAGGSGSGKSSLLQDIILGGAYRYSPEELRFIVLDFKDGVGLSHFSILKHVKMMSLKNRKMDASEIMAYIIDEKDARAIEIKKAGCQDIAEFNVKAKRNGGKLMPRLIILIDEFAVMPRSCYGDLKIIATQGRAFGMSLVISSQLVDKNDTYYGAAISQIDHRFEFKNSPVGNLMSERVSDSDKSFLSGGKQGSCIYKGGGSFWQMRSAFAGNTEEQEDFIRVINEKWSGYECKPPIITGNPERVFLHIKDIKHDKKAEYERYLASKKTIFVPMGKRRLGGEYLYKVDKDNHLLVILGNEKRAASIEYSIASAMACLSQGEPSVYYIDMNGESYADREDNIMMPAHENGKDGIRHIRSKPPKNFYDGIEEIYKVYKRREEIYNQDKDVGAPVEVMVHNAENFLSALKNTAAPARTSYVPGGPVRGGKIPEQSVVKNETLPNVEAMFREVAKGGKNCKIYFTFHFKDAQSYNSVNGINKLFDNEKVKDAVVIPKVPEDAEEGDVFSNSEIVDSLKAVTTSDGSNSQLFEKSSEMMEKDFYYALFVEGSIINKIIPYEWED